MKDPLVHIHPHAVESYEVLEGEMEFFIKDKWIPTKKEINSVYCIKTLGVIAGLLKMTYTQDY